MPRIPLSDSLSERQRAILALIAEYQTTKGYAPSYRQMAAAGISASTSVIRHNTLILERRGLLELPRDEHGIQLAHTMRVTDAGRAYVTPGHNATPKQP